MDLYLAIGGGQWNKYVAPTLKKWNGEHNENILSGSRGGGWNWFQRAFWPDQENIKAKESIPKICHCIVIICLILGHSLC